MADLANWWSDDDEDITPMPTQALPAEAPTPLADPASADAACDQNDINDVAFSWAHRQGWVSRRDIAAIEDELGDEARLDKAVRVLHERELISREQKRELTEVVTLSQQVPAIRLRRRIGSGAVGGVYLATSSDQNELVAVKVLHDELAQDPEQRARFEREINTLSQLSHPAIPRLYAHDCDARVPYLIMEYVQGVTLGDLLDKAGALPETYVLWAMAQVAQTLAYAYRRGGAMIHRDIKPHNLIVQLPEGTEAESLYTTRHPIKIIDFGLARLQEEVTSLTMTGMVIGTPRYMAPEQVRGEKLDWQADLYALGATMYHLLTGHPPFAGASAADVMMAHCTQPAPDPAEQVPALTRRTAGIVQRAMAKGAQSRYGDYAAFISACEQALAALDTRPMVLLRKPFVVKRVGTGTHRRDRSGKRPATRSTSRGSRDHNQSARGEQAGPTTTMTARARMQAHLHDTRGLTREAVPAGSVGGSDLADEDTILQAACDAQTETVRDGALDQAADQAVTLAYHEDVFGEGEDVDEGGHPATDALVRVMTARIRGQASELDLPDLEQETKRVLEETDSSIARAVQERTEPMPMVLLTMAAGLLAAVAAFNVL
ncbi:MAG: serine/threonine-protein kinase [Planctomycetota bacterium]|jgi:serine/threonine protein kinase|nr:serine/threonine-protein kinase [Planctomycetota bacterium]